MSTRSTIAMEYEDGSIRQVYCHWEGFIEYNGKLLLEHYSDRAKLQQLLDLGDLSRLGINLGVKHNFLEITGDCTFYGRDRNDRDTQAEYYKDFNIFINKAGFEEFNYLLRTDGVWYVSKDNTTKFVTVQSELKKIETDSLK